LKASKKCIFFFPLPQNARQQNAQQQVQGGGVCGIANAGHDIRATQLGKIERHAPELPTVRQASGVPKIARNRGTR